MAISLKTTRFTMSTESRKLTLGRFSQHLLNIFIFHSQSILSSEMLLQKLQKVRFSGRYRAPKNVFQKLFYHMCNMTFEIDAQISFYYI